MRDRWILIGFSVSLRRREGGGRNIFYRYGSSVISIMGSDVVDDLALTLIRLAGSSELERQRR